jgi:DNA-binding GntR family transcriptional regulator
MNLPEGEVLLLADQAWLALRELLITGGLRAGQFVSMAELVKLAGLPLAPVREAVKRAESAGMVSVLPKRGVAVMEASPRLVREYFDLRLVYDQEGARRLVRRGGEGLAPLRERHTGVLDAARSGITPSLQREAMAVDWELHITLSAALENATVREIYALNRDRISVLQHSRPLLPDRIVPAMEEHLAILDAIDSGDEHAAADAVRRHFIQTLRWWGILAGAGI